MRSIKEVEPLNCSMAVHKISRKGSISSQYDPPEALQLQFSITLQSNSITQNYSIGIMKLLLSLLVGLVLLNLVAAGYNDQDKKEQANAEYYSRAKAALYGQDKKAINAAYGQQWQERAIAALYGQDKKEQANAEYFPRAKALYYGQDKKEQANAEYFPFAKALYYGQDKKEQANAALYQQDEQERAKAA